jgi:hypothetical protein
MAHKWTTDQLQGAVQQAQNAGRFAVFASVGTDVALTAYSSEILDVNTCGPCADEDGTDYPTVAEAMLAYASGGFIACEGGPRCRGVLDETDPRRGRLRHRRDRRARRARRAPHPRRRAAARGRPRGRDVLGRHRDGRVSDGVDLFCGARGWEARAAASLGLDLLGVEWWQPAVTTSEAAGLRVRHADVAALNPADFAGHLPETGARIIAGSPPCPTFSAAGKGAGRLLTAILVACLRALGEGHDERERARREAFEVLQPVAWAAERARAKRAGRDPSREDADAQAKRDADMSVLVVEPLRWALALRPRAVAIEQVPACLPLWQVVAEVLEAVGYSTWTRGARG